MHGVQTTLRTHHIDILLEEVVEHHQPAPAARQQAQAQHQRLPPPENQQRHPQRAAELCTRVRFQRSFRNHARLRLTYIHFLCAHDG